MLEACKETIRLFGKLLRQAGFYRLLAFLMLIAFVKLILMWMYYGYPTFGIRELGAGAPVGRLFAINSIVVIFLVPAVGALTQRFSAYKMVILGGLISSASVFIMAMPTAWFAPPANGWPGNFVGHWYLGLKGSVHPYYVMIALFVIVFSFGEAFYSPRVYEVRGRHRAQGPGGLLRRPFLRALFAGQTADRDLFRRAAGPLLSAKRPAPFTNTMAHPGLDQPHRTGGPDHAAPLHPHA